MHKKQHPHHINLTSFCESGKNPTVDLAKLNYIQLLLWTQMRKFCSWYTPTKTLIMKLSNCLFSLIKPKTKKLPWFSQSKRRISFPWLHLKKAQVEESRNLSRFLEAHLGAAPSKDCLTNFFSPSVPPWASVDELWISRSVLVIV